MRESGDQRQGAIIAESGLELRWWANPSKSAPTTESKLYGMFGESCGKYLVAPWRYAP